MSATKTKRVSKIIVLAAAAATITAMLAPLDAPASTVDAASLRYIDELVAASGTFNILEIVPDGRAASMGYYISGQEPVSSAEFASRHDGEKQLTGWPAALSVRSSPEERRSFINELFGRLRDKGVLGDAGNTQTPLQAAYNDPQGGYYTETYEPADPAGWETFLLQTPETVLKTGSFTPTGNGPYRASYEYAPTPGGGYVQNIRYYEYAPEPGGGDGYRYALDGAFARLEPGIDLQGWEQVAIYRQDADTGIFAADPQQVTVGEILAGGGFDLDEEYYYVDQALAGGPGSGSYRAVVSYDDEDDAPSDGYTASSGTSYFSRIISGFTYVGAGGNYTYAPSGGDTYTVAYGRVYYKAGFTSNNLFKRHVFGLSDGQYDKLGVTVTVREAAAVTQADIAAAGLIYISRGADITHSGVASSYTGDIPDAQAVAIYNYAAGGNPLIVDRGLVSGITQSTPPGQISRIAKLCLLTLQSQFEATAQSSLAALSVNWTLLAYMSADSDGAFVNNNVYCFNPFNTRVTSPAPNPASPRANDVFFLVTPLFDESFRQAVYSDGFAAVLAEIQNENFLRQIAGMEERLPENVTVATSVRHVINYKGRRQVSKKERISVLDLQPANTTSSSWLTASTVRSWIGSSVPATNISIVHMTTGEFIGKLEDINETYDLIYIGASTQGMNVPPGGNGGGTRDTLFNDTTMNGLIYTNVGDQYTATVEMAGIRTQDYVDAGGTRAIDGRSDSGANLFRFSGNDITKTKVEELKKYVLAGYPIVVADKLLTGAGAANPATVDNSSYMYELLSAVCGSYENVLGQSAAVSSSGTVTKYLNVSKPSLKLTAGPPEYLDPLSQPLQTGYLTYEFTIDNITDPTPVSTTYNCRLFIDLNADGRYSEKERLGDIEIYRISDNALVLPMTDDDGEEYYALPADVAFRVSRQMPRDYVGIIPWKLEVIKNGADHIHASAEGFTRIAGQSKTQIKVLQLLQQGTANTKLNLNKQLTASPKGIYGQLIAGLEDFSVAIDSVENGSIESGYTTSEAILDYFNGYDMLIIGFNDCYDGIGSKTADALVAYIESGKSVLFTHDTTSLTQVDRHNFPMAVGAGALVEYPLSATNVFWNSTTNEYKSVNENVSWRAAVATSPYSTTPPPFIRQGVTSNTPTYIVFMSTNQTSSTNEQLYYNSRVTDQVYKLTGSSYESISDTRDKRTAINTYTKFNNVTGSSPVIYVYPDSASGRYRNSNNYNITATCNFTKFSGGQRYYATGLTFSASKGSTSSGNTSVGRTHYAYIMRCLWEDNTPDSYTVTGTYNQAANTYTINNNTYYPPTTGAPFPPSKLYTRNPATQYELSTIPNAISDWGYYFNTVIRDYVGLDRYGVTNPALKAHVDLPRNESMTQADMNAVLAANRSVAFKPKSARTQTVDEYQGYTNYALIRFTDNGSQLKYMNNTYNGRETTYVSQVNKGQITTYPYNVNTSGFGGTGTYMQIGNTHEQYFQINMNTDDIVVWYCLSSGGGSNSYYNDIPNDVVNAYYIYNKGNVTYSGVGHTSDIGLYGHNAAQQYVNEAKLFVNTMIAAYQAGTQNPTVRIMTDARGTQDMAAKYVTVDPLTQGTSVVLEVAGSFGTADESRAVYFRITDPNMSEGKTIVAQYSVSDADGGNNTLLGAVTTYNADGSPVATTYNAQGQPVAALKGGYVYKFYLPREGCLDRLEDPDVYSIRVNVIITTTIESTVLTASDSADIRKRELYSLS